MAPTPTSLSKLCQSLKPDLRSNAIERTESILLRIVRANLNTQYASEATLLAGIRDAVSAHGSASDAVLIEDFRRCVPLSDYDAYKPFMNVFDKHPCKEAQLENLFAPGLPSFLALSSATSGKAPKLFPKYLRSMSAMTSESQGPTSMIINYAYREVKEVEREPGQIVKKIPVSIASGGIIRVWMGWTNIDEDESRMSLILPDVVAPWAASMIKHHKSFLMVHALFTLACRDLNHIVITFSTLFYDMVRHINEEWDLFLSSIRSGTVPDLPGVGEVRSHLQAHLHANPDRAEELREIGPPFSREGWAASVWPKLSTVLFVCSGPFATVLPKVKSVIGPTVAIRSPGYGSSESHIAVPHQPDDLDVFVLRARNLVEFLDVAAEESHENIFQAWELEVGKRYEIVLTTNDGLWRYRLGDVIEVIGFDVNNGSPVFAISGRRSLGIRIPGVVVTDIHIATAIQAVSLDVMQISELTTVLDDRKSTQTVGYVVELSGSLGPNAHLAPSTLAEGLGGANSEFQRQIKTAGVRLPTVRIVGPGTFAEYRQWISEKMEVGPGQVKVPVVMIDETSKKWILERVVGEL